jgi:hypothetical protein
MTYSMYGSAEGSLYHPVVIKDNQRFWKRILIVDDEADVTVTFKAVIEESNDNNDVNKKIEVYTSNNPVEALSEFRPMAIADNRHFGYQNEDDLVDFIASEMQKEGLDIVNEESR